MTADEFERAWEQYQDVPFVFLRRYYPNLSYEDRQDLAQEIAVRALRKRHLYKEQDGSSFLSWLWVVARSVVADWFRKKNQARLIKNTVVYDPINHDTIPDPEDAYAHVIDQDQISRVLQSFSPRMREIMSAYLAHNGDARAAAKALGVTPHTVWARLHETRTALREQELAHGYIASR